MYYNDHSPPHFHARYGEHKVTIAIEPPALLTGSLPPRALGLVVEWAELHRADLIDDWERARGQSPLKKIEPLR